MATDWTNVPLPVDNPLPSAANREALIRGAAATEIKEKHGIVLGHCYFREGMAGTQSRVFARQEVVERLYRISRGLGPDRGLYIFDAFRSRTAQLALFEKIRRQIRAAHADWSDDDCLSEARKFVAYPENDRAVTPHNSGGAIDLTVHHRGKPVPMGGEFDAPAEHSQTRFYEQPFRYGSGVSAAQWDEARRHRRELFHRLIAEGFVNYHEEWWHYDLGDRRWGQVLQCEPAYGSMEDQIPG